MSSNQSGDHPLKNISKSFDALLNKPADLWTQREINIYQLLQSTMEKYKVRYSLAQFKLDVRDIRRNVKTSDWYRNSKHQRTINWCLDQIVIKSYSHSKQHGHFKVMARLSQAKVRIEVTKKEGFSYLIQNEVTDVKTRDLSDLERMTTIFGINPEILEEHRAEVINDLSCMIREIGLFY